MAQPISPPAPAQAAPPQPRWLRVAQWAVLAILLATTALEWWWTRDGWRAASGLSFVACMALVLAGPSRGRAWAVTAAVVSAIAVVVTVMRLSDR